MPEKLLTTADVAQILNISRSAVCRYCRLGVIKGVRLNKGGARGGIIRIKEADFNAYLDLIGLPERKLKHGKSAHSCKSDKTA